MRWRLSLLVALALLAGCGGPAKVGSRSETTARAAVGGWSAPVKLAGVRRLEAVSCPSASFCMAVGEGQAVAYVDGQWGTPKSIDSHTGVNGGLDTVSCLSPVFCVAGDGTGDAFTYIGTHWTEASRVSKVGIGAISCTTMAFCAAADTNGVAWFFNGSRWSAHPVGIRGGQVDYISCPTTGFCMGLDSASATAISRVEGGRWISAGELPVSLPAGGSEPNTGSGVSCSSSTFCAAVDNFGEAFRWTGGRWSAPVKFDPNLLNGSDAVSCASASACAAVDQNGLAARWDGHSWSPGQRMDTGGAGLTAVSCATPRFCVAVDNHGDALTYQ